MHCGIMNSITFDVAGWPGLLSSSTQLPCMLSKADPDLFTYNTRENLVDDGNEAW